MYIDAAAAIAGFNAAGHNNITKAMLRADGVVSVLVIDKIDPEFANAIVSRPGIGHCITLHIGE